MLSLLIPTYNYNALPLAEELHRQAEVENILFEIIVLDDASENFNIENEKVGLLRNGRYLRNENNLGRTLTRKKLAEAAQFDTLLFLDADVMPSTTDFIKNYIAAFGKAPVVFGGYAYRDGKPSLRLTYGKEREEKTAAERSKNPYGSVFSGNLLIDRQVFLNNNFAGDGRYYGMDIYFCYQLYKNNIPVLHIDNPIYHLGLESDTVFFEKSLEAVRIRKQLLGNAEGIENINSLLRHYKNLKKKNLDGVVSVSFKLGKPLLKKMIMKKNPNLFCLDLYRLGYICSLKD